MSPSLKVVVAPDSFKGSATAAEVAAAIGGGWGEARPGDDVVLRPMADGGEGTIDAFASAVPGAVRVPVTVSGPDGHPVTAEWLWLPDVDGDAAGPGGGTGVIELANTSGLTLMSELRPMDAHTIGFGEAIVAALDYGVTRLLLAIGGSSSTDGGAGALSALGARFFDADGAAIAPGGAALAHLETADLTGLRPLPAGGARVITDVTNPLLGWNGAAAVFGPQKGADDHQIAALDANLERLADIISSQTGYAGEAGAGAAGGTGFGLRVWGASIRPGSEAVGEVLGLAAEIDSADVVITGEGRFDGQSAAGKVPSYVLALALRSETFPLLVAGSIDAATDDFAASISLVDLAETTEAAMLNPVPFLWAAGRALAVGKGRTPSVDTAM